MLNRLISKRGRESITSHISGCLRYKGRSERSERTAAGRKLDESQESALCRYIDFCDSIYLPPKRQAIAAATNAIQASCHIDNSTKPPTIGSH
jgi:hypothetical protein